MSRASVSRAGRSGNSKVMDSSANPAGLIQTNVFKIDPCHFLAWCSILLGSDKDWLVRYQDNVTEWDSMSWWRQPVVPVRQHYTFTKSALPQVETCPDIAFNVARA